MHSTRLFFMVGILSAATLAWSAEESPTSINVQGKLAAAGGGPITAGNYTLGFKLFDVAVGGAQVWPPAGSENHLLAIGTDGLWTALLGKDSPLLSNVANDTSRYLEITITPPVGSPETLPRIRFGSTPFTLESSRLSGRTGDEYVEVAGDVMSGRLQIDYGSNGTDIDLRQDGGTTAVVELSSAGASKAQLVAATKGHLLLSDDTGDLTAILDATPAGGGVLDLNQEDGTNGALLSGGTTANGSSLTLNSSNGSTTAGLDAQEAQGGVLSLNQEDGSTGATVRGGSSLDGASLSLQHADGSNGVLLDARDGGSGGQLELYKGDGGSSVSLLGGPTVGGGSQLNMRNSVGAVTFSVLAEAGSVGIGTGTLADAKLQVDGGSDATLADGSGYLEIGEQNTLNLIIDNNEIQARNNSSAFPLFLQGDGGNVGIELAAATPDAPLHVGGGTDANLSNGSGYAVFGLISSANLVMDVNELQARSNGAAADLYFQAAGGDVVMGTVAAAEAGLDVNATAKTVAVFNRSTDDGTVLSLQQDDTQEGSISVAVNTVSYNAFTGSHYGWTDRTMEHAMLMVMTGDNRRLRDEPSSEVIYGIEPSSTINDSRCLGAYLALSEPSQPRGPENPHLVMAVGNGEMWVSDEGGDIAVGDYLISSSVPGHATRDDGRFAESYIVARAAETVLWSRITDSEGGARHKKISVLFESFVRDRSGADLDLASRTSELEKALAQQAAELNELRATLKTLTGGHGGGGGFVVRP